MKTTRALGALIVLGLAGLACALRSGEPPSASSLTPAAQGQALYGAYCADCHGPLARGDGPRIRSLVRPPPDLTSIAKRNGNVFPADTVASFVDGRTYVEAHGPREMPAWGRAMDDRNQALDQELKLTPAWIAQIVAYLETLQERPS
jgi:mono/diheme cytochrome c family protein